MQRIHSLFPHAIRKYSVIGGLVAMTLQASVGLAAENKAPATNLHQSDEEAFLIRRIAEFWKDGDLSIVKGQINEFLSLYPKSSMKDYLQGILGDLYVQENKFQKALDAYSVIQDKSISEKIALNKMHCLYELGLFSELIQEGKNHSKNTSISLQEREHEYNFLMGEGFFRQGLAEENLSKKTELMLVAEPYYQKVLSSSYGDVAKFSLAEIYRSSKQNSKGSDLYLELAEQFPDKKEHLLLNAALLKAELDKDQSIALLNQVVEMKGSKQQEAKFNRLILHFQTGKFEEVISAHRDVQPYVSPEHMQTFAFVVGKSFFSVGDYLNAIPMLEKYLSLRVDVDAELRDALLIEMMCAKNTDNEALFAQTMQRFESQFANDEELPKAYFLHAMICKSQGQLQKTEQDLYTILKDYPNFKDMESLIYEYGVTTYQNGNYQTGYEVLQNFLTQYPQSEKSQSAWRHYLSCCLKLYKNSVGKDVATYSKDKFFTDLSKVLKSPIQLSLEEAKEYRFIYAKLAFELNLFNESLDQLTKYVADYANDPSRSEAHLLMAMSLNKLNADEQAFCSHLEEALQLNPGEYSLSSIHLQLFNAYLSLGEKNVAAKKEYSEKAATHLYEVWNRQDADILLENQLWLAGFYYDKAKSHLDQNWSCTPNDNQNVKVAYDRALAIYEKALLGQGTTLRVIDDHTLYIEAEVLKFVDLLSYNKQSQKKLQLLTGFIEQQNRHPEWKWKFRQQALFELGKSYLETKDHDDALETFNFIVKKVKPQHTWVSYASMLESCKLQFNSLDPAKRTEKSPDVMSVLNQLKELQIRKTAETEPLHLEAAMEYVQIRSQLAEEAKRDSKYLFFLVRMKEDFTSSDAESYLKEIAANQNSKRYYDAYMKFIDAEIYRMQSKQLAKENHKTESEDLKLQSSTLIEELLQVNLPTSELHTRVTQAKKNLR